MRFLPAAVLSIAFVASAHAITADELIAKHVESRGGLEKLRAIQTLRLEGLRFRAGGSNEQAFVEIRKRPGSYRSETTMQGLTAIRAGSADGGWTIQPFRGRKEPERLAADALNELTYDADIDGPLVDYAKKNSRVEYLGTEDVDGTAAHKLKLTRSTGDIETIFLDPDYFLEIRRISQHRIRGTEVETEYDFGSYEQVNGVYFPFSIEWGSKGSSEKNQKIDFKKADANVDIDDAIFRFPGDRSAKEK